jgi:hypothetical protein
MNAASIPRALLLLFALVVAMAHVQASDRIRRLKDSIKEKVEQKAGTRPGEPAGPASAPGGRAAPPEDPCLDPGQVGREPNFASCELSWRAYHIKLALHDAGHLHPIGAQMTAVAVTRGVLKGHHSSDPLILVTTNDSKLWKLLDAHKGLWRRRFEELGPEPEPKSGEHAEDVAEREFQRRGVDRAYMVRMGSDPKACGKCTANYGDHPWIRHERLKRN